MRRMTAQAYARLQAKRAEEDRALFGPQAPLSAEEEAERAEAAERAFLAAADRAAEAAYFGVRS